MQKTVSLTVNGKPVSATVEGRTLLVQLLREQLGLTGTHVGGKLAQIGSRLIDSVARRMAENFFTRFVAAVAPEQAAPASGTTAETEAAPADSRGAAAPVQRAAPTASVEARPSTAARQDAAAPSAKKEIRLPPAVWVTGLVAIVGAMLYFFTGRRVPR